MRRACHAVALLTPLTKACSAGHLDTLNQNPIQAPHVSPEDGLLPFLLSGIAILSVPCPPDDTAVKRRTISGVPHRGAVQGL